MNTATLGPMDRLLLLRGLANFDDLPPRLMAAMAQRAEESWWPSGARILRASDPVEKATIVVEGSVALRRDGVPVGTFGAPTGYGFIDVMAQRANGLEAVALEDTLTLSVSSSAYWRLLEDWFPLVRSALRGIAGELVALRQGLPIHPDRMPRATFAAPALDGPIGLVERLKVLLGVPIFAGLGVDTLLPLARRMRIVRVPAGATLWETGEPATWGIATLGGIVRCEVADGRYADITVRHPIGFLGALAAVPRTFTAVARTETLGLAYDIDTLTHMAETRFEMSRSLLSNLSRALMAEQVAQGRARLDG